MFPLYIIALIGVLLVGLILLVVGVILLLRLKNKLAGILVGALGLVITLLPAAALLFLIPIRSRG